MADVVTRGRRKSPQEKKRLSYSRDRRNDYGENDKSSRKGIAKRKRIRHRSERHREQQRLGAALGAVDVQIEEAVDERLTRRTGTTMWRKYPDAQLGHYVVATLNTRVRRGIAPERDLQPRIEKVRRSYVTQGPDTRTKWR